MNILAVVPYYGTDLNLVEIANDFVKEHNQLLEEKVRGD